MGKPRRTTPRDWPLSADIIRGVIEELAGDEARVEVGRVRKLGGGLFRRAFIAWVEVDPDPGELSAPYVCLIPHHDADDEIIDDIRREARVLRLLEAQDLSFGVPRLLAEIPLDHGVVLVESAEPGGPLDQLARQQRELRPWEVVGQLAAAIHDIRDPTLLELVAANEKRLQTAELALSVFNGLTDPLFEEAFAWAQEHLVPNTRPVFLHGDLLGQNILIDIWEPDHPPSVIDWSAACLGDPAYDLAIVTRGYSRPFKQKNGLRLLLDAYAEAGGATVQVETVRIFELCMLAGWYRQSLEPDHRGHPPEEQYKVFRGLCRRTFG